MKGVWSILLLASLLTLAAPAEAAATLSVNDIVIADEEGDPLRIAGSDGALLFQVRVNNTGTTALNASARVRLTVAADNGTTVFTSTATLPAGLAPGNGTTVEITWSGKRSLGNHTVTATVEGHAQSGFAVTFQVAETSVPAGTYVDRILQYTWLWAAFLLGVALFGVVLAARKR